MRRRHALVVLVTAALLISAVAVGQVRGTTELIGVDEIRPGMRGYGLTVFRGTTPERFDVEVIDVLHNFRPDQDSDPHPDRAPDPRAGQRGGRDERQPCVPRRPARGRVRLRLALQPRSDRGGDADPQHAGRDAEAGAARRVPRCAAAAARAAAFATAARAGGRLGALSRPRSGHGDHRARSPRGRGRHRGAALDVDPPAGGDPAPDRRPRRRHGTHARGAARRVRALRPASGRRGRRRGPARRAAALPGRELGRRAALARRHRRHGRGDGDPRRRRTGGRVRAPDAQRRRDGLAGGGDARPARAHQRLAIVQDRRAGATARRARARPAVRHRARHERGPGHGRRHGARPRCARRAARRVARRGGQPSRAHARPPQRHHQQRRGCDRCGQRRRHVRGDEPRLDRRPPRPGRGGRFAGSATPAPPTPRPWPSSASSRSSR